MGRYRQPSLDEARAYFDAWNAECRDGSIEDIDPEIAMRGRRVIEHMEGMGGRFPRILEVGCGTGWLSGPLARMGEVTAIDLAPKAIEIARKRGVPARLIAGDFLAYDFGEVTFDAVVVAETLFYVQDPAAAIAKIAKLLRPGGLLALTCINAWVYERRRRIGPPEPGQPRQWLTIDQLRALLVPEFDLLELETVDPQGHGGILRIVNSYKLNELAGRVFSPQSVRRWKERRGWGAGVIVIARRKLAAASATA